MKSFKHDLNFQEKYLTAYTGCPINKVVMETTKHSLSGMEFLIGIPGLIGGAIVMNAGCFGQEIGKIVEEIIFLNINGKIQHINNAHFKRRYCDIQKKHGVIIAGKFRLKPSSYTTVKENIDKYIKYREEHHPSGYPSAGGIFKNYQLLRQIILKDNRIGDAEVCLSSPNWILNKGNAKFSEVMQLILILQRLVKQKTGKILELEVKVLG